MSYKNVLEVFKELLFELKNLVVNKMAKRGGLDIGKQKHWIESIEKEKKLRLSWFRNNEQRLKECAEKTNSRIVPQHVKDDVKESRQTLYRSIKKYPITKPEDPPPLSVDDDAIVNVMRPVDPEEKNLLYCGIIQILC